MKESNQSIAKETIQSGVKEPAPTSIDQAMKIDATNPVPTLETGNSRRGRRAGMPPQEEKKSESNDPDKITFGGRRLGGGRAPAKDPFAKYDSYNPIAAPVQPQPPAAEEKKGGNALNELDALGDPGKSSVEAPSEAPKKLTYEERMAQERGKGGSLLDMIGAP